MEYEIEEAPARDEWVPDYWAPSTPTKPLMSTDDRLWQRDCAVVIPEQETVG